MSQPSVFRIMTVCTGNICRSPMAEVVLRDRFAAAGLGDRVVVDSTGVRDEEEGNLIDSRAFVALVARGYAVDGEHRARLIVPAQVAERDLVLPMTANHARELRVMASWVARSERSETGLGAQIADRIRMYRSFDPAAPAVDESDEYLLDVADPWYGGPGDFEACLDQIEAAADGIVDDVAGRLG